MNFPPRTTRTEKIELIETRLEELKNTPMTFVAIIAPTQAAIADLEAQLAKLR